MKAMYRIAAVVIMIVGGTAASADEPAPAWAQLGMAEQKLKNLQLTDAVTHYQSILDTEGTIPEALHGLGIAYLGSGDVQMAVRELQNALELQQHLYTPEDRFAIRYALSDAYYYTAEHRKLQDVLLAITAEDPYFTEEEHRDARRNYRRTIQEHGIDQLFQLYRLPYIFSRRAHRELGMQFLIQNLPSQAVDHLIFAALMGFSDVIEEMLQLFPLYRYESVQQTYRDIFTEDPRTQHLREYLLADDFTAELLLLADAFYIEGQTDMANQLWRLVAQLPGPEVFSQRARQQLREPSMPQPFIHHIIDTYIK